MNIVIAALKLVVAAGVFAAAGYAGVALSRAIARYVQRPAPEAVRPEPPLVWFVVGSALFGAIADLRGMDTETLALAAIIAIALVGSWHSVATYGRIPDAFTLVPLLAIVLSELATQNWGILLSVVVTFAPFATMAYVSKGKGLGWDDAKLAALGGALLGMETALFGFALACMVAVTVAWARKRTREPIPFAPYMVASMALSLLVDFTPYS
ncbi:MAG TPA: prepilin peptidase [Candidatus Baltobacteraceae bacterium]